MKKILLGAAACVAFAAPAFAADLPARTYTKAPVYKAPEVIYNWTGFYLGGHIGGVFPGGNSLSAAMPAFSAACRAALTTSFPNNWVIGAEAQYSWLTGNSGNGVAFPGGTVATANTDQLGSVTGRLGYAFGPTLLYAKGGYAWRGNDNLGRYHRRRPGCLYGRRRSSRRLHRRRGPRIHVHAELVDQRRVPVLQLRQHDLH